MLPFPDLPAGQWPLNILNAVDSLHSLFNHACQLIAQQSNDNVLRFRIAADDINNQAQTLLDLENHNFPLDWIHEATLCLAIAREALLRIVDGIQEG